MASSTLKKFSVIPQELKSLCQWVCWEYSERGENGKRSKKPLNPRTWYGASSTNPGTWTSFTEALTAANNHGVLTNGTGGVGFVFSENDNYCGVDLDDAINERGEISEFAAEILRELDSYAEISTSGRGLHIIIKLTQPLNTIASGKKMKYGGADFECYDRGRYFIMTGTPYGEVKPIRECTTALKKIYARYFPTLKPAKSGERVSYQRQGQAPGNGTEKVYGVTYDCSVDEHRLETQFLQSLITCGITPRENLTPLFDGEIHRFATVEDTAGGKSGAYKGYLQGCPVWYVGDWRKNQNNEKSNFKKFVYELSKDERREYAKYIKNLSNEQREQQEREKETAKAKELQHRQEEEEKARARAWEEYETSKDVFSGGHPYLIAKHIDNAGIWFRNGGSIRIPRVNQAGELLIPLVNAQTRNFQTLQRIFSTPDTDGKFPRNFYSGISSKGACCELIPYTCEQTFRGIFFAERIFICEGAATGFAVLELTEKNYPVICAMSASNIINVARAWRQQKPRLEIIIAADNDAVGIEAANQTIAAGYADKKIMPKTKGTDWNDYLTSQKQKG